MINKLLMLAIISFTCAFSITELAAQKHVEKHKIVLIEKVIDNNGKVTEVKKTLEGEAAKAYIEEMEKEEGVDSWEIDGNSNDNKIKVTRKVKGEVTEMEYAWDGGELPAEVKELLAEQGMTEDMEQHIDLERNGNKRISMKTVTRKELMAGIDAGKQRGDRKKYEEETEIELEVQANSGAKIVKVVKDPKRRSNKKAQLGVGIEEHPSGVFVGSVMPGSSAMEAGLLKGDVITAVNGLVVKSPAELIKQIKDKLPGEVIQVKYERGGSIHDITVLLKEAVDPSVLRDKTWNQSMNGQDATFRIEFHESLKK